MISRKSAWASSTASTATATFGTTFTAPPLPSTVYVFVIGLTNPALSVTGIAASSPSSGTFVQASTVATSAGKVEVWLGYNFTAPSTSWLITRSAGTSALGVHWFPLELSAAVSSAPTIAQSTPGGATSGSADSGAVTPAIGDLLIVSMWRNSTTADSTARTHTGANYGDLGGQDISPGGYEYGFAEAASTASSKEVWTLGSSVEWAAIQAKVTFGAAPSAVGSKVLKGLSTASLDAASSY